MWPTNVRTLFSSIGLVQHQDCRPQQARTGHAAIPGDFSKKMCKQIIVIVCARDAIFTGHHGYSTVKRKDVDVVDGGNLATLGGRPRSVEGLDDLRGARRRRETMEVVITPRIYKREAQEMTDVNTSRVIQVVVPGDVNFALNSQANNETVVIQSARSVDPETICMSVPSFVGGLVMLLLVLAVASLVAAFLFVRVRHFDRKGSPNAYVSEFVKVN